MRDKLLSLAAAALLASVGGAYAKGPVTLTDSQLDTATAGDSPLAFPLTGSATPSASVGGGATGTVTPWASIGGGATGTVTPSASVGAGAIGTVTPSASIGAIVMPSASIGGIVRP